MEHCFSRFFPRSKAMKQQSCTSYELTTAQILNLFSASHFFESPVPITPDNNPNDYQNYKNNKQST